jgi:DNA-binding PadR family transcriptional regulator
MGRNENAQRDDGLPALTKWGLYILVALGSGELHGYAIRQEIERLTAGRMSPSEASLYENIAKLLDDGLIERTSERIVGEGRIRKLYRVTGLGARVREITLEEQQRELARLRAASPPSLGWARG